MRLPSTSRRGRPPREPESSPSTSFGRVTGRPRSTRSACRTRRRACSRTGPGTWSESRPTRRWRRRRRPTSARARQGPSCRRCRGKAAKQRADRGQGSEAREPSLTALLPRRSRDCRFPTGRSPVARARTRTSRGDRTPRGASPSPLRRCPRRIGGTKPYASRNAARIASSSSPSDASSSTVSGRGSGPPRARSGRRSAARAASGSGASGNASHTPSPLSMS